MSSRRPDHQLVWTVEVAAVALWSLDQLTSPAKEPRRPRVEPHGEERHACQDTGTASGRRQTQCACGRSVTLPCANAGASIPEDARSLVPVVDLPPAGLSPAAGPSQRPIWADADVGHNT